MPQRDKDTKPHQVSNYNGLYFVLLGVFVPFSIQNLKSKSKILLQRDGLGPPIIDPIEQKLERAVRLGSEGDLGTEHKQLPPPDA